MSYWPPLPSSAHSGEKNSISRSIAGPIKWNEFYRGRRCGSGDKQKEDTLKISWKTRVFLLYSQSTAVTSAPQHCWYTCDPSPCGRGPDYLRCRQSHCSPLSLEFDMSNKSLRRTTNKSFRYQLPTKASTFLLPLFTATASSSSSDPITVDLTAAVHSYTQEIVKTKNDRRKSGQ